MNLVCKPDYSVVFVHVWCVELLEYSKNMNISWILRDVL